MEEEAIKQIGHRLKGLREVLDIPVEEIARLCDITPEEYLQMENATESGYLHVSRLQKIARQYGVSLDELLFGEEPRMSSYFITRKGKGPTVERQKAYKYQSLAGGFRGRKADPFMVVIDPKPDDHPVSKSVHQGQELDVVFQGRLELTLDDRKHILNEGDSIYFDSSIPHCLRALDGQPVSLLAVILQG